MKNSSLFLTATALLLIGCSEMGGGNSANYLTEIAPCTIECYVTRW